MNFIDVYTSLIGTSKSDSINQLIQLSVIQLSGGYCNSVASSLSKVINVFDSIDFIEIVIHLPAE